MFINMRFKSPMQSWGDQTNTHTTGSYRGTSQFPTYSGVFGLLCACMGINKTRDYGKYVDLFNSIKYTSAVAVRQFSILVDNQNMGGGYRYDIKYQKKMVPVKSDGGDIDISWNSDGTSNPKLSDREYLEDADFIITIEVPDEIANIVINHIKNPTWMPTFGRSCCIPSTRLFVGSFDTYDACINQAKQVLEYERLIAYMSEKPSGTYYTLDMYDVPVVTQAFKYTRRKVYKTII